MMPGVSAMSVITLAKLTFVILLTAMVQLNIHDAKPGSVNVSLKVEPYNGSYHETVS